MLSARQRVNHLLMVLLFIFTDKGEWRVACMVVSTAGVHAEDAYVSSLILVLMTFFVSCGDSRTSDANAHWQSKPHSLSQVIQRLIPPFRPAPIHSLPQNFSSSSEVALGLERPLEDYDTHNTQSHSNELRISCLKQSSLNTGLEQSARQARIRITFVNNISEIYF